MAVGWGRAGYGTDYWGATSVSFTLTGIAATSAIGSVIVYENEVINLTGFGLTASRGTVTTDAEAKVYPEGLGATLGVGVPFLYDQFSTAQIPNYSSVATSQTPTYTTITGGRDAA